ncbi:hypothetical protein [Trichocoleus desertorum]|uniref:Uncharacterized protein n=1 Tax=Trichocoleus desertorum GB2-A4 TaxID=2933944 RepID=A0ABV0J914_9CYAN|nr:hypothetical protein [Trichocoleus sp. FACHB-46]
MKYLSFSKWLELSLPSWLSLKALVSASESFVFTVPVGTYDSSPQVCKCLYLSYVLNRWHLVI